MWIDRDFEQALSGIAALPIKVLKGPHQTGKTSLLERLGTHQLISLDDAVARTQAAENPRLFLDNRPPCLILDEGPLVPELFPELKRRLDEARRKGDRDTIDVWITGSNQTVLQRNVRESLAGRASYFDFQTLSLHELGSLATIPTYLLKGGWPELYVSPQLSSTRYLNDLVSTFIEKDLVSAAGIERRAAFTKVLGLTAARVGQLMNYSEIATHAAVDVTTIQSWMSLLETNGILRKLPAYSTNLNKRLIKSPKYYFEDPALATRLQGWTELEPLLISPAYGALLENIGVSEVARYFINRGTPLELYYARSKEKVEVDLLIALPNQRWIAAEVKATPQDFSAKQLQLLDSLQLNIIERWVITPTPAHDFKNAKTILLHDIWEALHGLEGK